MATHINCVAAAFLAVCAASCVSAGAERKDAISYWSERREAPAMQIHILELDLSRSRLEVTAGDTAQGREFVAQTTRAYAAALSLDAAVNGGYFTPFQGGSRGGEDYYPHAGDGVDVSGASIAFGLAASPVEPDEDERVNAIVCISGAVVDIRDGQECAPNVQHALAAGPRLLGGGERRGFEVFGARYAEARHPRTALGVNARGDRAWIIVVDGRQPGVSDGATLWELTTMFVELGAVDAINLDGGGSSTMVMAKEGEHVVVSSPIHTGVPGRERPAANHIGVRILRDHVQ